MMHTTPIHPMALRTSMSSLPSFTAPMPGSAQPLLPPPNLSGQHKQQSQQRPIPQHAFAPPPQNHMAPPGSHSMYAMPPNGQAADRRPITPRAAAPSAPAPAHHHHHQQQQQQAPVHQHSLAQPPSQEKPVRVPTATIELDGVMSDYTPIADPSMGMGVDGLRRNSHNHPAQPSHLERSESDVQRRTSSQSAALLDPVEAARQERLKHMYLEQQRQKLRYGYALSPAPCNCAYNCRALITHTIWVSDYYAHKRCILHHRVLIINIIIIILAHCRDQEEREEKATMRFSQTMQQKGARASAVTNQDLGVSEWVDESRALVQSWATVPSDWDRAGAGNLDAPPRVSSTGSANNNANKAGAQVQSQPVYVCVCVCMCVQPVANFCIWATEKCQSLSM